MIRMEMKRTMGDYGFRATDQQGQSIQIDASAAIGGSGGGVRPMQTLLMALGGCSAIDIVSILKKQRQTIDDFTLVIEGEREAGTEPSLWKRIEVEFQLSGLIDEEKARKACALSIDKYCSVAETLRRAGAAISWKVTVTTRK